MNHLLKTESEYFQAAAAGLKNFEVRINDRNYQVGDTVVLQEVFGGVATGRALPPKEIKYILHGGAYGLGKGYCVLQL